MNLGNVLKKWRVMSELTLEQAAREMDLNPMALSRVEDGGIPSFVTFRSILNFLLSDGA